LWKIFVHKDSIWTKVITAIHGVNGNVNSSGGKVGRSCWLAIVDEVWALHKKGVYVFDFMNLKLGNREMVKFWLDRWFEGGILKDLFPRMFALENMKEVWNLESSGEFSMASIRRIIDEMCFLNIGDTTRWVKYVPIKVNILAWKIRCDVLPTRMNLSRRCIDIQAISCPICDYGADSLEHLFFRCNMIRNTGKQIVRWWNINYEEVSSYDEWKTWLTSCRMASKLKQVFEGVWKYESLSDSSSLIMRPISIGRSMSPLDDGYDDGGAPGFDMAKPALLEMVILQLKEKTYLLAFVDQLKDNAGSVKLWEITRGVVI
nr:RNA-directed DNA polymerase, eukaryota [Tanacetum cinerariifolium]